MQRVTTEVLEIVYETGGPRDGPPVFLLHGWPDDVLSLAITLRTGGYKRVLLDGIGHFPMREAPEAVAKAVLAHFS